MKAERLHRSVKFPILTYHSIDDSGSIVSTAPEIFRRQMRFLSENEYRVVSLEKLIESFNRNESLPPKIIALTFDDGFRNFYQKAFPILDECGFGATVFLVTDFCGKSNDWAGNPPNLPRSPLLSWSEISELHKQGIEFGAHTRTHPDLTKISAADASREIVESKKIIEDQTGAKVKNFAYPYGKFDRAARRAAEQNFAAACSVKLGKARRTSDRFALERIDSYYLQNPKIFNSLSSVAFDCYLQFRQCLRGVKSLAAAQLKF